MTSGLLRRTALALPLVWLAGCATPLATPEPGQPVWSGRLALRVDSEPPQSLSAGFELRGDARRGELALSSPLGQVMAQADWDERGARLRQGTQERVFASMDELTAALTGAPLPLDALFGWLRGRDESPPGWQVDLSGHAEGRLIARRLAPQPGAELRMRFE